MTRKLIKKIIKLYKNFIFKQKLREMDKWWDFMGGNCFGLFPPSFYYTHTEEEIEQITAETTDRLYAKIEEYMSRIT